MQPDTDARHPPPPSSAPSLRQCALQNDELWLSAIRTEQRSGNEKAAETMLAKAMQVRQGYGRCAAVQVVQVARARAGERGGAG